MALLASTSYIGLLEGSLFDAATSSGVNTGAVDLSSLVDGARSLKLGQETGWKWQSDTSNLEAVDSVNAHSHMYRLY